ncbi:UbiA prenyltransferase family protein [Micromonospora sp. WMMA1998]|uniref:UbiA prenyltransferase family protein n=1 Tax=Micromonospora sp. WMMA1998 TaxID=3015167 RepID=UPI00248C5998|nr:UbiA prenyltransferase family protein [Micromonospora sp. WMMA1998]WBC14829.1 UbiA prenyltransferase family protein [Micromonospora sp. WMMA1998]
MRILDQTAGSTGISAPEPVPPVVAGRPPGLLRDLLRLVRPHQWLKNVLVVPLPLIDAGSWRLNDIGQICRAVLLFVVASALVYVGNDVFDRHRDRLHPVKRLRPVASGRISVPAAGALAAALAVVLVLLLAATPAAQWWPLLCYLVLNIAYTAGLKHVALLDVFIVALGFQLRLAQGYATIGHAVSTWLPICLLGLCLMLVLGKRRSEITASGGHHRPSLRGYSLPFLDLLLGLTAALVFAALLFYLTAEMPLGRYASLAALVSAPMALLVLFRYLQVVVVHSGGGDPVRTLVHDRVTVAYVAPWVCCLATLTMLARYPDLFHALVQKVT